MADVHEIFWKQI